MLNKSMYFKGYVPIDRDILQWEPFNQGDLIVSHCFLRLLLSVYPADMIIDGEEYKKGTFKATYDDLLDWFKVQPIGLEKLKNAIRKLIELKAIEVESAWKKGSIFKIVNYQLYEDRAFKDKK